MREAALQNQIRLALSKRGGCKLFRANVGRGWTGNDIQHIDGALLIRDPRPLSSGLPAGYSDLTGYTMVEVTPDMVGSKVPVFTAIEVKTASGRVSEAQQHFLDTVGADGALCGVARSADDAANIINGII